MSHDCDRSGCLTFLICDEVVMAHVCDGCGREVKKERPYVFPHKNGGWWHAATCMPPSDWQGFSEKP
jgi:hypothetical protein